MDTPANERTGGALPSVDRLREVCWELGTRFPSPFTNDHVVFSVVHPRLGYLHWHMRDASVERLKAERGDAFHGAVPVVRVYDVTDILFDGFNAHAFLDLDAGALSGKHYLPIHDLERVLLAEAGFRLRDGGFHALARSSPVAFDRDRPSGRFSLEGLYVGRDFQRLFPVENVLDAPVYERLNLEVEAPHREGPLSLALVHAGLDPVAELGGRVRPLVDRLEEKLAPFGVRARRFGPADGQPGLDPAMPLGDRVERLGDVLFKEIADSHRTAPIDLVHCHDWHSVPAGVRAATELELPLVLTVHSTEHERSRGTGYEHEADAARRWEGAGLEAARLVVAPHSSTRHQLMALYGAPSEKVLLIPDVFEDPQVDLPDPGQRKRDLGLDPDRPLVLFSGEVSHAAGADLLMDAVVTVCKEDAAVQFVLVGEGPLKAELEGRAWQAGIGHRCRFVGGLSADAFEGILMACDFVVIPARTWQDEGLAQMAKAYGKPVLTTHQSHIHCIAHGQNGLVTYDNPGSIIWGIRELMANPLTGNMLRLLARQKAGHTQSVESIAAEHYAAYERLLLDAMGGAVG